MRMEIPTGDNPPISQRPYGLALRHVQWVQDEIETPERAGVITKSVSPWASPIVIVPKKTSPGEPPRRRMCVDYRMLNSLLPKVEKAHTKAKGVLTLVPIPKIDEIYAKLEGSTVYSTFDMRSGYYHLELTTESQPKSAFVVGGPKGGKWEFKRCPFGLTQAPAYFQALVNQVLEGLNFAFGYLDDILIFSPDMDQHLEHVRTLFEARCNLIVSVHATKQWGGGNGEKHSQPITWTFGRWYQWYWRPQRTRKDLGKAHQRTQWNHQSPQTCLRTADADCWKSQDHETASSV